MARLFEIRRIKKGRSKKIGTIRASTDREAERKARKKFRRKRIFAL